MMEYGRTTLASNTPALSDFDALVSRRGGRWYQACLRITGDPASAEDAVQDALLKSWHGRAQFRATAEMDTWIHRIAVNAALDRMRRERVRSQVLEWDEATAATPPELHQTHQLARDLDGALTGLSDLERLCFVLKHLEQWRLDEIAQQLQCSLGSVKQALFRAVRKLRGELQSWRNSDD
jgi:RNA polymerase sigma-70 factor (ECF subfamily)